MFGMGFVCLFLFVGIMLGIGFVCLSVVWVTYVWHCVCMLFLGIMFCIGFVCCLGELCWALGLSVCWLGELCFALGLSVCWLGELCLVMIGLFGTSTAD